MDNIKDQFVLVQLYCISHLAISIIVFAYNREIIIYVCVITMEYPWFLLHMIKCVTIATVVVRGDQYGRPIITCCTEGSLLSQ